MIELRDITLRFGQNTVFSHYHASLPEHGIVLLMGESGVGKTTLLRMLAGLQKPDSGAITGLQNRRVSVAFQEPRLLPWRSARENVSLVSDPAIADALLGQLNMTAALDDRARTLSGGQQQRVSLARAFAHSRDVVLLDEPFSGLDEENRRAAAILIKTTALAIVVSHDAADAALLDATVVEHL